MASMACWRVTCGVGPGIGPSTYRREPVAGVAGVVPIVYVNVLCLPGHRLLAAHIQLDLRQRPKPCLLYLVHARLGSWPSRSSRCGSAKIARAESGTKQIDLIQKNRRSGSQNNCAGAANSSFGTLSHSEDRSIRWLTDRRIVGHRHKVFQEKRISRRQKSPLPNP